MRQKRRAVGRKTDAGRFFAGAAKQEGNMREKFWEHFKTVTYHRHLVRQGCFKVGLYRQGLLHDLSKYSPTEFLVGAKYYQGNRSPNNAEREATGLSRSWLHHKGRNKHHFEYWIDYTLDRDELLGGMKMPVPYRIAACRTYQKEKYTDASPWEYHKRSIRVGKLLHEDSRMLLERLLKMLAVEGEEATFAYIRKLLRRERRREFREKLRLCRNCMERKH